MLTARLKRDLPQEERIGNVSVHRIGWGNRFDKLLLTVLGPLLAKRLGAFDLVWSIMASYSGFAAVRYCFHHPRVPYLLTLQEGDSRWDIYKHVWWCWPLFKRIFTRASHIQTISHYLARWAKEMGAKCPIDVVPNGVSLETFYPLETIQKRRNIITVSRLVKKNGIDILIQALEHLPHDVTPIVGAGRDEKVETSSKLNSCDRTG